MRGDAKGTVVVRNETKGMGRRRAWGPARRLAVVLSALGLGFSGCFSPPREAVERLEAVKREGEATDARLDVLEERLLGGQAKVQLWRELAARHQQVSAVACSNQSSHLDAMLANLDRQAEKAR